MLLFPCFDKSGETDLMIGLFLYLLPPSLVDAYTVIRLLPTLALNYFK